MESTAPPQRTRTPAREPGRGLFLAQALAPLLAGAVAWLTAGADRWSVAALVLLAAFAIAGELTMQESSGRMEVSSSFLALILASVILGPGPAALIGAVAITASWLRFRWERHVFVHNLTNFTWCPLLGGLFFYEISRLAHVGASSPEHYLLVFVTYLVTLAANFLFVAGYRCYLERCRWLPRPGRCSCRSWRRSWRRPC